MTTATYKKIKKNGSTLYVLPGVTEDKNFETQNENYNMYMSHFIMAKLPRLDTNKFRDTFDSLGNTLSAGGDFADSLIESLRNYVANQETTIRNTMISQNEMYYDVMENYTCSEKIFWKWARKLGIIDFELATSNDYPINDPKYAELGPSGNTDHFRKLLWKERTNEIYSVNNIQGPTGIPGSTTHEAYDITFNKTVTLVPNDYVKINVKDLDTSGNSEYSIVKVVDVFTTVVDNDTITVEIIDTADISTFGNITDLEVSNNYERFVKFMSEITGVNNVQLADRTYTETYAYISHQQGETPYLLWETMSDSNYKPNSSFPILGSQLQNEIQGGENANNPILTNNAQYPGSIWAQFDSGMNYKTSAGDVNKRSGDYYGNHNTTNIAPFMLYPQIDSKEIDGLTLNFDINDYNKARSYTFPIDTFKEFSSTSFDNIAPKDFDFNVILWFYTIEDVTGNNVEYATNLYGIEFIDSPYNDLESTKNFIPTVKKLVTNGYQDGNSYTFSLDTNISIESYTEVPTFDPNKIYTLFQMELYYEALTRMTYMVDKLGQLISTNDSLKTEITNLRSLIFTQENVDSIKQKISNIEKLLTIYSTLQIGNSDTIIPELDTSVSPAIIRLNSIDKKYGSILHYFTKDMYNEFENNSIKTQITAINKTIPINSGKDFLVVINNDDNQIPDNEYDTTIIQDKLNLYISKDLFFKQSLDILLVPAKSKDYINNSYEPINDKELNLYLKYDNGVTVSDVLLKTLSLPVLKTQTLMNVVAEDEVSSNFESVPEWNIKHVLYGIGSNPQKRVFKFIVEGNLTENPKIDTDMRIFLKNFIIRDDISPATILYTDLSKQYKVLQTKIINSLLDYTEITNVGTGYAVTDIVDVLSPSSDVAGTITVTSVDGSGGITGYYYTNKKPDSMAIDNGDYTLSTNNTAGSGALIKLYGTTISELSIEFNSVVNSPEMLSLFASYDTLISGDFINVTSYLKCNPILTFLKGTFISITRISDTKILSENDINQRYQIKINTI